MGIRVALPDDMGLVCTITRETISGIYPRYYSAGAVAFFLRHHSDDRIAADIAAENGDMLCYDVMLKRLP